MWESSDVEKNETELAGIPKELSGWNIHVLNNLVKTRKIETDDFDYKSEYKELSKHLCAFANNSFGQMILGMRPIKNKIGRTTGIQKKGFLQDVKDDIRNEVSNAISLVEPTPIIGLDFIKERRKVFPVVQITGEEIKKPYMHKLTGICYVRIGALNRSCK